MRTFVAVSLDWLHQLALSIWLGGIVVLGAVSAPAIFGAAKAKGDTHWGAPLYTFAGTAIGEAFRRFNYVVLVAGALMLGAGLGAGLLSGLCRRRLMARAGLTAAAWAIAAWLTWGLYPRLLEAREAGQMELFDQLHRTYSGAFSAQMLLLLTAAALTAWMHFDRGPQAAPEEVRQPLSHPVTAP